MGFTELTQAFSWKLYSKKIVSKIMNPRHVGSFTQDEAKERGMRLAEGCAADETKTNELVLYWLVDPEDGVIADAKFRTCGQTALIAAAEAVTELLIRKNYDQAQRVTADLIDKELRDSPHLAAFPEETQSHLNLVISAIDEASEQCKGIPLAEAYVAPPAPMQIGEVLEGGYPGFDEMPLKNKIALIEQVLDDEVRPYIALDGGGIELMDLLENRRLIVAYQGNCTSCFAATGATLSYIQQVLRAKVHPDLDVQPDEASIFQF
jgi:NifU-like protein